MRHSFLPPLSGVNKEGEHRSNGCGDNGFSIREERLDPSPHSSRKTVPNKLEDVTECVTVACDASEDGVKAKQLTEITEVRLLY